MKFLNLKNGLHRFYVLILVVAFVGACNKDETVDTTIPELSQEELGARLEADPDFQTLRTLNQDLLNEVTLRMQANNLSGEDVKRMYVNREGEPLQKVFGGAVLEEKLAAVQAVNSRLMENYSELIPEGDFDLEAQALVGFDNLGTTPGGLADRGCGWRYWICAGGAWSGLAACTIGTSGWGIFFCNLAYYAALALCTDSYC